MSYRIGPITMTWPNNVSFTNCWIESNDNLDPDAAVRNVFLGMSYVELVERSPLTRIEKVEDE